MTDFEGWLPSSRGASGIAGGQASAWEITGHSADPGPWMLRRLGPLLSPENPAPGYPPSPAALGMSCLLRPRGYARCRSAGHG